MRAKSLLFKRMASWCADNCGASSVSIFCRVGLVSAALRFEKVRCTRSSNRPVRSKATTVLSNVALSVFAAMASTSLSCSCIPVSVAGTNWSSLILSKGGRRYGRELSVRKGLAEGMGEEFFSAATAIAAICIVARRAQMRGDDDRVEKGFDESMAGCFVEPRTCLRQQTKQSRVYVWVTHAS